MNLAPQLIRSTRFKTTLMRVAPSSEKGGTRLCCPFLPIDYVIRQQTSGLIKRHICPQPQPLLDLVWRVPFLLELRPYAFFPFWPKSCASQIKHKSLKRLYCGFLRTSSDLPLRKPIVYKLTVHFQVLFNGFFLHMHQNPL
jgi:hypothetical protein